MHCESSVNFGRIYVKFGSVTQAGNSVARNSKYSNISVIDFFRQLNNVEPVEYRGTIQTAPLVHNNLNANLLHDTMVSDSFVFDHNMGVLTYCETLPRDLVQSHCCAYSQGVIHQVDVLYIDSIGSSTQCLYLHPASGDNVYGFYAWNVCDSKIFKRINIPSGTLNVSFDGTFT